MRAALLFSLMMPLLGGCGGAACGGALIETAPDPGGTTAAFRSIRDCGATTGYSTQVAVGREFDGHERAAPVFIADSDHGVADEEGGAVRVALRWDGARRLTVFYARHARVFRAEPEAEGVTIRYVERDFGAPPRRRASAR
ncbi:hypothetical protein ACFQ1E_09890 [Sphingomonas canadensis]|uniref:Lipoprotein n=1 Tax=Sphingomonas canadensis TaxID=1219257 RepID=A0ABW3H5X7_9SPHN|nr:hypothetical protein [Sphingomonas canadensis]MCW3836570.1 hypothetical protein [Sphingomonas canadensis]